MKLHMEKKNSTKKGHVFFQTFTLLSEPDSEKTSVSRLNSPRVWWRTWLGATMNHKRAKKEKVDVSSGGPQNCPKWQSTIFPPQAEVIRPLDPILIKLLIEILSIQHHYYLQSVWKLFGLATLSSQAWKEAKHGFSSGGPQNCKVQFCPPQVEVIRLLDPILIKLLNEVLSNPHH